MVDHCLSHQRRKNKLLAQVGKQTHISTNKNGELGGEWRFWYIHRDEKVITALIAHIIWNVWTISL